MPKAETAWGSIVLECGNGNHRRIEMARLVTGAQTYVVDPDTTSYFASWTSHEVPARYSAVVRERVAAPDADRFTVFSASKDRQKPAAASLRWGRNYYLIWREELSAKIPDDLLIAELGPTGRWHCALVGLPETRDPAAERWLTTHTGLVFGGPLSQWGVVYPPPFGTTASGDLVLPDVGPMVLSFASNDETERTVELISMNQLRTLDLPISKNATQMMEVRASNAGERVGTIVLGEQRQGIEWTTASYTKVEAVTLELSDPATGATRVEEFHLPACYEALTDVRHGRLRLLSISVPSFVRPRVCARAMTEIVWTDYQIPPASLADGLGDLILDRDKDIWINCGAYGSWVAMAERSEEKRPPELPNSYRRELEWLFRNNNLHLLAGKRVPKALDGDMLAGLERLGLNSRMAGHARKIMQSIGRRR
ncbi:hypothetical protein [Devosia ginsengisoli]|uniref:Uncharacterized protein n=1 Tax=Devosia ginsengisoli TaxID=400770 RepID=A0A5B8LU69_9HYPH|nr:hypothetical protein [Devosia ginsengisoli]QDZ11828.1 hypothetical protein FPZ08_14410 [Devosia ginsengisoli]